MPSLLSRRLDKLEGADRGPAFIVVRVYEGETEDEAWRHARGDESKPTGKADIVVMVHALCSRAEAGIDGRF